MITTIMLNSYNFLYKIQCFIYLFRFNGPIVAIALGPER